MHSGHLEEGEQQSYFHSHLLGEGSALPLIYQLDFSSLYLQIGPQTITVSLQLTSNSQLSQQTLLQATAFISL